MKNVYLALLLILVYNLSAQNNQLSGKLINRSGEALPGALVHVSGSTIGVNTSADGSFSFINLPAGKIKLVSVYLGYSPDTTTAEIEAGKKTQLNPIILKEKTEEIGEVVISGNMRQGSESKAINLTKNSDKLVTVISAEGIAKYPDHNGAEVLKRVAGATVQYDKGEGAYVSLRGTPLDWTATLINGDRLPVADEENFSRTFEFEVFPANLIDYIQVTRTVTPDLDGDNVGGTINFDTKKQVDKRTFEIDVSGGASALTKKPTGNIHFLWADRSKNKKFSYAINGSYYGRYYGAQAYLIDYGSNFNQSINRFDLKDYDGTRQTAGASLLLRYDFSPKLSINARAVCGTMLEDKWQRKQLYYYTSGDGSIINTQAIHGKLNRLLAGGNFEITYKPVSRLQFTAHIASYSNRFWYGNVPFDNNDPRNGYFTAEFTLKRAGYFKDADLISVNGGPATPGSSNAYLAKVLLQDNPYGHGDTYRNIQPQFSYPVNVDSFKFKRMFSEINNTREQNPVIAQLDGTFDINNNVKISAGGKFYWKRGERDISYHQWQFNKQSPAGAKPVLLDTLATQPFDTRGGFLPEYGSPYNNLLIPFITKAQLGKMVGQFADRWLEYTMNEQNPENWLWVGGSYKYHEYTPSAYIMASARVFGQLNIVGGLRIEDNIIDITADTLATNITIDYNTGYAYYKVESRTAHINNLAILPALNLTWNIKDNQNLRFAVSRTYHRQNFSEIKPGAAVINYDAYEFTFGNPNLKPTYSVNLDLAYEYFWGNKGMFSVGTYYKNVTDHIFATTGARADPVSGIIYKSFQNSGKSWVWGLEGMIKRQFTFLPKWLSGFGADANITYALSRMKVPGRPKAQAMAEQTPLLFNVGLFYEKYGVSAHVSFNYTGAYLKELNLAADASHGLLHTDGSYDIYMNKYYSLDAQVAYTFKKHYTFFVELNNLLDWPYFEYRGEPYRPIRVEYYRQRGQIGFKYTLD